MIGDRRSILAGIGGTMAAMATAPAAGRASASKGAAQTLTDIYARANQALLKGDVDTSNALAPISEDFVLMSPFGGKPSHFAEYTPERMQRMGRFFRNGRFRQELVAAYEVDGMVVLATIERANVEVGGLPAQDWALRVTSVFTRDGSRWRLAHRHADPLVDDVSLEEAAQLGRGERLLTRK